MLFEKIKGICKAKIGRNAYHNVVIQDSTLNNPVFCTGNTDLIRAMGQQKNYEFIQKNFADVLKASKESHPLYPLFSAAPDANLKRLVSTPETEDAFKRYPKRIKGTYQIDRKKYPDMDKSETPWEYV